MDVAPLRAVKSLESQLGTRAKPLFPGWLCIARGEESPLPLIYGLGWLSNSERQCTGKGRGDKEDQRKRGRFKNKKQINKTKLNTEEGIYQTWLNFLKSISVWR